MPTNPAIFPSHLNPERSPELEQEVRFFLKWGYLVVDNALTGEQIEVLRGPSTKHLPGARHSSRTSY